MLRPGRVSVVVAAFATLLVALPASAGAPIPSGELLSTVADNLYSMGSSRGFAGQVVDEAAGSLTLHWKGPLPRRVRDYLAAIPAGVTVKVSEDAQYSRFEEQAAADLLNRSTLASTISLTKIAANSDGSGLTVYVSGAIPDAQTQSGVAGLIGLSTSAITYVSSAETPGDLAGTRYNDTNPWKGGARTVQGSSACSTGFSVLAGSYGRLVSANHCDPPADLSVYDGAGQLIAPGSAVSGYASIDSQLIDPSASPATTPQIYTGAWSSGTTSTVKNWASNWTGQTVCTGGATTGSHCGTITNDAVTLPGLTGSWYIEVSSSSALAGNGDSGGPVYATVSGGVQARGIILRGDAAVACGAYNPDVLPTCYQNVYYAPISVVLNTWGVSLEVG